MPTARDNPTVTITEARKLVRLTRFVSDIYFYGYSWIKHKFLPATEQLAKSKLETDRFLAATGFYLLGDVHHFNGAPLAAIRSYRRSLRCDPTNSAPWREIGMMYKMMGQKKKATRALRKAVQTDPKDEFAQSDLEILVEGPLATVPYDESDPYCKSSELLAAGEYRSSVAVLAGKKTIRARLYRVRVFGALEDVARVIDGWWRIAHQNGEILIDSPDWYFTPGQVWHSPEFWKILKILLPRVKEWGSLKGHDSLRNTGVTGVRLFRLFVRYHSARTGRDVAALRRLSLRHPGWKEPTAFLRTRKRG